jgi:hypothetical protein
MGSSSDQRSIDGYTASDASTAPIVRQTASSRTWGDGRPPQGSYRRFFPLGVGRGFAQRSTRFFVRLIFLAIPPTLKGKIYDYHTRRTRPGCTPSEYVI